MNGDERRVGDQDDSPRLAHSLVVSTDEIAHIIRRRALDFPTLEMRGGRPLAR